MWFGALNQFDFLEDTVELVVAPESRFRTAMDWSCARKDSKGTWI